VLGLLQLAIQITLFQTTGSIGHTYLIPLAKRERRGWTMTKEGRELWEEDPPGPFVFALALTYIFPFQ
jgi:hypothetical protein